MKVRAAGFRGKNSGRASWVGLIMLASIVCVVGLGIAALSLRPDAKRPSTSKSVVRVYCAAGVAAPVEKIVEQFNDEFGTRIEVARIGGSGELAGQLQAEFASGVRDGADIFISADDELLRIAKSNSVVAEILPIALQRPVIAIRADSDVEIESLEQLVSQSDYSFGVASNRAAIGKMTRQIADRDGFGDDLSNNLKTDAENVMTLAQALLTGSLDAAVVWDTTVSQINQQNGETVLQIAAVADNRNEHQGDISLGVVTSTASPTLCLKFARYLTAPEKGNPAFEEYGFETISGDRWEEVPEIHLYCGSMFTPVLEQRVRQFETREGVNIYARWEGCGKLVAAMEAITDVELFPDAYLACDISFLDQVKERFDTPVMFTNNQVVMAVRRDSSTKVDAPGDLLQSGLRVGICDPEQSALGWLTKEVFSKPPYEGLYDKLAEHASVTVDVGPTLISQLMAGGLDVVLVYKSNVLADPTIASSIEIVAIGSAPEGEIAQATQPWAISKETSNPYLMQRLYDTIVSQESRAEFQKAGFDVTEGSMSD